MYSVKMRSSQNTSHISGAETICDMKDIEKTIQNYFKKGFFHENGEVDFLNLKIEKVTQPIQTFNALNIYENHTLNTLTQQSGVSRAALNKGRHYIQSEINYRGAIILCAKTGRRLDSTKERGVRVTHFAFENHSTSALSERVQDALAIATCISHHSHVKGELCISDDLSYTTGYYATPLGYHRLHHMKANNSREGGRIIFVDDTIHLDSYIAFLEKTPKRIIYNP
ncbi:6-carboxyhexanoate--CoA ligase [Staphylococcus felis]|uniref:6-carboxyhexanoate--CoA ligase n=1 Tax=Staphylococcus felis TaxID=46127 RepID=UPI000E222A68|nr:6-carboxyhexanoate--CoA ligase [Staphylococcus felis]REH78090.1 6-carboxyhexanoate--CoA ligase [Staphylococcus felis]REI35240.1 6-carboxyhexanoate--CoA ligase [Staphylococcus felis]